jgi:ATP-dependent RNA helicase RhlE
LPFPDNIDVVPLSRPEKQGIDREIDRQKRLADPEFKGAFHEKKTRRAKVSPLSVNHKSNAVRDSKSKGRKKGR